MKYKLLPIALLATLALLVSVVGALAGPDFSRSNQVGSPVISTPTAVATAGSLAGDLDRVRASRQLVVGTALDNPPFSFYRDDFTPNGFDIALMDAAAQQLGVQAVFNDFAFEGLLSALQLGQVDAAIAAISLTPQRLAQVDFTNPYFVGEDGILAASSSNLQVDSVRDLAKLKVGVQLGSVYQTYLKETLIDTGQMPPQNLMTYLRPDEIVRDLAAGNIQAGMLDLNPAQVFAAQGNVKLVGQGLFPQVYAIAVRKGSSLLPELNRALANLQVSGVTDNLAQTFLTAPSLPAFPADKQPAATPSPTPTVAATPTPVPCIDGMAYIADVNLDDRNMRQPPALQKGQSFTKTWRIRNAGTCSWTTNFSLTYVRGNTAAARMGAQDVRLSRAVAPGEIVDVSVPLVAPQALGTYQGFFQMKNGAGVRFGETIWVGIRIPAPPTPTPPPPPPASFSADRTTINQGECATFRWSYSGVKAVYFFQQGQPFHQGGVAGQASKQVCPLGTTIYTLRVVYPDDRVQEQNIAINVNPVGNAPQIAQLASSPEYDVVTGQCLNLWWDVRGDVGRVALVRDGVPLWDYAPVQGSKQDCPPGPGVANYELQAFGSGGLVKALRQINVRPGSPPPPPPPPPASQPEIRRMSATDATQAGGCIWVSWEFGANVAYARLIKNGRLYGDNVQGFVNISTFSGNPNGDCDTGAPGIYTYRLEAFNTTGQVVVREVRTEVRP